MKSAGFGDVMNQEYQVNPPKNVRAEQVINGWINSFNDYRRDITPYSYRRADQVGNGIDWVFATNSCGSSSGGRDRLRPVQPANPWRNPV